MSSSGAKLFCDYPSSIFSNFRSLMEAVIDTSMRKLNVMMPCRVVNIDRKTHEILVQPLVKLVNAGANDGNEREMVRCTAWRFSAGNFVIDVPIMKGDTGWVISADRDTDLVKSRCLATGGAGGGTKPSSQNPITSHIHQFRHGIFIPDRWQSLNLYQDATNPQATYDPSDGRLTIQSIDGRQRISLGTTGGNLTINMNAADSINIITNNSGSSVNVSTKAHNITSATSITETTATSTETVSGNKTISAASVTINGDVTINGKLTVSGKVMGGTVSLQDHIHNVTSAPGTTSAPVAS